MTKFNPDEPLRDGSIKYMGILEFSEAGFLQEANRQFFHPHGLALERRELDEEWWEGLLHWAEQEGAGSTVVMDYLKAGGLVGHTLSGVWDYRDDPEGMCYGDDDMPEYEKAKRVFDHRKQISETREAALGYIIQPVKVEQ